MKKLLSELCKVPTSKEVCESCCAERGQKLCWGDSESYDICGYNTEDGFYCPVTNRLIFGPDNIGSVQSDCPKRFEHLKAAIPESNGQMRLFELYHDSGGSVLPLFNAGEMVYLEHWKKRNERRCGINGGAYSSRNHFISWG